MLTDQATRPWGRSGAQLSSAPVGLLASREVVGGTRAPLKVTVIATGFEELAEESVPEVSQEIWRPAARAARDTMPSSMRRPMSTLRQPTQRRAGER
jgi:hypothetical protein